jgi:hypothetical protein
MGDVIRVALQGMIERLQMQCFAQGCCASFLWLLFSFACESGRYDEGLVCHSVDNDTLTSSQPENYFQPVLMATPRITCL